MQSADYSARFWAKVHVADCWEWTAALDGYGYGVFWHSGRLRKAHRVAYEMLVGSIPEGLQIDHLCRNRACVNPDHLEPVTQAENIRRGRPSTNGGAAKRAWTHCVNGHPFDEENTYVRADGRRKCRACNRAISNAAYHRAKAAA